MPYATLREMCSVRDSQDNVLIESPFRETTKSGRHILQLVQIALTPTLMIIAPINALKTTRFNEKKNLNDDRLRKLFTFCPLESVEVSIFKKSRRQSLKVRLYDATTKYFDLDLNNKREIFWKLWCCHVIELRSEKRTWPFINFCKEYVQLKKDTLTRTKKVKNAQYSLWIDKHLYLGSVREYEDNKRPIPVPGLGPTEDIKLLYLKPQYFGCWDQSEHWVQCD